MNGYAVKVQDVYVSYHRLEHMSIHQMIRHPALVRKEQITALRGLSFRVSTGEIVGIIGRNGSGKTTLLKTVSGIIQPDSGTVDTGGLRVALMSLGAGFKYNATGRDNIMIAGMLLGYPREYIREKIPEIIAFSELEDFIDLPVSAYSSGMYAKLSFSITAVLEADIMLVDEVLSVGDEYFQQKSFEKMKSLIRGEMKTGIIVSHDLDALTDLCTRVIWLDEGKIRMDGETDQVLEAYKEAMRFQKPEDVPEDHEGEADVR